MSESIDSRAELSLKWCCLSVRSAVVIISPPTLVQIGEFGFYRQRVVLCSSNREICVQGSSNIFQMVEFNKAAQSLTDALIPQAQKRIVLNRLAKDNIALIVVLEVKFGNQPTDPSDRKVFPDFYILGWNSTESDAEESDIHIHKAIRSASVGTHRGVTEWTTPAVQRYNDSRDTMSSERTWVERAMRFMRSMRSRIGPPHCLIRVWSASRLMPGGSQAACISDYQLMDINESPVYVLLNPAINHAQKDLPVTIYESG